MFKKLGPNGILLAVFLAAALVLTTPSHGGEKLSAAGSNEAEKGGTVTRAEFLSAIIKESGLNLDNILFIKAPEVSDVATDVSAGAPYAQDIIIAGHFGVVESGKPFRPGQAILREEAASMAVRALNAKIGPIPMTMQYIIFEDSDSISPESSDDVQSACKLGLFGTEKRFRPGDRLTVGEFSSLLESFKKALKNMENKDGVTWKLSEDRKRITLYWGEKPTGGYAVAIKSVTAGGGVLKVVYSLRSPGAGEMVTQAITYPSATADVPGDSGFFDRVELIRVGEGPAGRIAFRIGRSEYSTVKMTVPMDAAPFLENGRAYVPVRYLAEALGVPGDRVVWSQSARAATIFFGDVNVTFALGGNIAYVNEKPLKMDVVPVLRESRMYLPARYLAEAAGCRVDWDPNEKAVIITVPGNN